MLRRVTHPGQILADELAEVRISAAEFARQINVPANRVSQLISGKRSVTSDTALRLAHWFGTSPQFWLNLQTQFDLVQAEDALGDTIRVLPNRLSYALKTSAE